MNAKQIARRLEFIKYFTLQKKPITLAINADVDQHTEIENEYVQLSGNFSFTFESIITDYAYSYDSSLKGRKLQISFYKKPDKNSPDFKLIDDLNGLMTPAIANNYIKDGQNFKRYIFPSYNNYQTYSEWYSDTSMEIDKRDTRSYSMNIIVKETDPNQFEQFLNESLSDWTSRFSTAVDIAFSGNFNFLYLYDPRIFKYALTVFEDRKKILTKLLNSTNWYLPNIFLTDEFELFVSLINNINNNDAASLYNYMFEIDSATGKTNLQQYENTLPSALYDELIKALMRSFYSAKTASELFSHINRERLFPIGLEITTREPKQYIDLDNPDTKADVLTDMKLGVEYNIETNYKNSKINIVSALEYKILFGTNTIEFRKCEYIGKGNISFAFDDIVYITPYFMNKKFEGVNIPYGCIIPVPAFSLEWLNSKNNDTEKIVDQIGKLAVAAAVIFPIFSIFEESYILYNIIGLGFTVIGNALGAGVQDQIKRYDEAKSTPGHPYTKGQDFLNVYYLISSIYVGTGIKNAISGADNKIKALFEVENLLGSYSVISDFRSFMTPNDNLDSFNLISQNMDHLQKEYNRFKYLKSIK